MAHMIPKQLLADDYDPASKEDRVWKALERLSNDYYVFHSYHEVATVNSQLESREIDFLVVHPKKGILVFECKAGDSYCYEDRRWKCWDKKLNALKPMHHGGPYKQAESAMRSFRDAMKYHYNENISELKTKINFFHAVWFIDLTQHDLEQFPSLPEEASFDITLFREDLINPEKKIEKIFDLRGTKKALTDDEFDLLLNGFLSPKLNLIPTPKTKRTEADYEMAQLLREQYRVLEFIEEQQCAVINGAAGTGKTMVAIEKARLHSLNDEKVLFLCYNRLLRDRLDRDYKNSSDKSFAEQYKNVDFYTLSKLTKEITGSMDDFEGLNDWLVDCYYGEKEFGYKHIIIDEGQDFAMVDEEAGLSRKNAETNTSLINSLQDVVVEKGGTFYLFYDKNQMIQGGDNAEFVLPDCIQNADCRLTLNTNCRNTMEIASTSMKPLKDSRGRTIKPKSVSRWEEHDRPSLHLVSSEEKMIKKLNDILDSCEKQEIDDVVILTSGSVENSCLEDMIEPGKGSDEGFEIYTYKGLRYRMTTCRKFKGLESDALIFIDLNKNSFSGKRGMNFYVGSSRAKYRLDIICEIIPEDYYELASTLSPGCPKLPIAKKMGSIIASALEAELSI